MNIRQGTKHDNEILIDFNMLFDIDLAIYNIIKFDYGNSSYVNRDLVKINNEYDAIYLLLLRKDYNPLSILIPNMDVTKLYEQIMENKQYVLSKTKSTDLLYYVYKIIKDATSANVVIQCEDNLEAELLAKECKKYNFSVNIIICKKSEIDMKRYTTLYTKYLTDLKEYKNLSGKNIYISNAGYNFDANETNIKLMHVYSLMNVICSIDMYAKVKYANINKLIQNRRDNQ